MIFVIVGPTGSGKTSLAKTLAKAIQAPIINADAFQVYEGMNIGTNKDGDLLKNYEHVLFDVVKPNVAFSVKEYQAHVRRYVSTWNPERPLIMVGGTGLYIKASLFDFSFHETPIAHPVSLELTPEQAYEKLKILDPISAQKIHPHNVRRVNRALAIFKETGQTKSSLEALQEKKLLYPAVFIGLDLERKHLYEKINERVEVMIKEGLIEEVQHLKNLYGSSPTAFQGIGYKEVLWYLEGKISQETLVPMIQMATRRYAKRQWTYFKHQLPTQWFSSESSAMLWLKQHYGNFFSQTE